MTKPKSPEIKKKQEKSKSFSPNVLYWFIFLMAVVACSVVYGIKFSEFSEFADDLEEKIAKDSEVLRPALSDDVLGVEDSTGEDGESGVNLDDEEIVAEADSDKDEDKEAEVDSLVDEIEEERREKLRTALNLQLPDETDNPSYPVTFTEPTEDGVSVQIDGDGFAKKKSPYVLPALSIGKHTLNFKFEDEDEVSQNLEEMVIVIPRPPKISEDQNLEFRSDEKLQFSGTALPHSKVVFLVSSDISTTVVDVNSEGVWTVVIKDELSKGSHNIVSFVRKDGYASNFSEPVKFSIGVVAGEVSINGIGDFDDNISFDFDSLFSGENLYYTLGAFSAVSFILILFSAFLGRRTGKKNVDPVVIGNGSQNDKKVSLREKFGSAGVAAKAVTKKVSKKSDDDGKKDDDGKDGDDAKVGDAAKSTDDPKSDADDSKKDDDKKSGTKKSDTKKSDTQKQAEPEKKSEKPEKKTEKKSHKSSQKAKTSKPESEKKHPQKTDTKKAVVKDTHKPEKGKVYSKEDFLEKFSKSVEDSKDSNKLNITLTSRKDEEK